jgi:hypothetical protein
MTACMWRGRMKATTRTTISSIFMNPGSRTNAGRLGTGAIGSSEGLKKTWHISFHWTFWVSREAIKNFAGEDIGLARYDSADKQYLPEFEPNVTHYEM